MHYTITTLLVMWPTAQPEMAVMIIIICSILEYNLHSPATYVSVYTLGQLEGREGTHCEEMHLVLDHGCGI